MRFRVEHIDERGEHVDAGLADAWAVEATEATLEGRPEALDVNIDVKYAYGLILVTGTVECSVVRECERCGEATKLAISAEVDLSYASRAGESDLAIESELHQDELNVGWFDNGEIVVGDVLREAISLELPSRVVCQEQAGCDERTRALLAPPEEHRGHPGLAALKNLNIS